MLDSLSLQKNLTLLIPPAGCSVIADEIKDGVCGWGNTLSGYSMASESAFV